jgi:hypothetical protein
LDPHSYGGGIWPDFPHTSAAALSSVTPQRIGYASSLFNMLRNTGAEIGIAFMINTLLSRQQIHQSRVIEHSRYSTPGTCKPWKRICPDRPCFSIRRFRAAAAACGYLQYGASTIRNARVQRYLIG